MNQKLLKEILKYHPKTGDFYWKKPFSSNLKPGDKAGYLVHKGYVAITIKAKRYCAHRLAWLYMTGAWPSKQIDHINQVKSDNRFCNLREATNQENARNGPLRCTNTSGYTGVYWREDKKKWQAAIKVDGKLIYLGRYKNIVDAAIARKMAEVEYGFSLNHGATEKITAAR